MKKAKKSVGGQPGRRSPPMSLKPLRFGEAVDALLDVKPTPKKKPAAKKAAAKSPKKA